jgi:AbrB family looped-hinge helix DNA binding protein
MSTKVTVKGQVTLPKAVREAAGIRAGDRVKVYARTGGGVIVEREEAASERDAYRRRLEDMARRKPFRGFSTDEVMRLTRGEE